MMKWAISGFLVIAVVAVCSESKIVDLPKKPGYVPVYIRFGNQPLSSISPELAAAFQETSAKIDRGTLIQELNRASRYSSESSSEELHNEVAPTKGGPDSSISESDTNESISAEKPTKEAIKELLRQMKEATKSLKKH